MVATKRLATNSSCRAASLAVLLLIGTGGTSVRGQLAEHDLKGLVGDPIDSPPAPESIAATSPIAELEQLLQSAVQLPAMQQEVTTVAGHESTVGRSPAAVFVITQEMIQRSGATCLPEVLRMAPGVQVARISSSQWAITARGFNSNLAGLFATNNKLLVLIDGRTVYTPFYNGTYWDVQDVLLSDIDRIEVIRGPGATIWGANAVNGVINVITKPASETVGGLAQGGAGTEERGFTSARVGNRIGDVNYRVYGKWFERDATFTADSGTPDDWRQGRGGFRMDWTPTDEDLVTLQGDLYEGRNGFLNTVPIPDRDDDEEVRGGNLLWRWTRTYSDENDMSLQVYYDVADRVNTVGFVNQHISTYDVEFRHHLALGSWHNAIWGLGYRAVNDKLTSLTSPPGAVIGFDPPKRTFDRVNMFAQDEIALTDTTCMTLGAKLLHNDFTGWEVQPSIRACYSPDQSRTTWAAVSRAVRTPSRIEQDGVIATGGLPFLDFVPTFGSEELIAYEWGYRAQPEAWYSWDLALFYNQYENLSSLRATPPGVLPFINYNGNRGEGYGAELAASVDILPRWSLSGNYSFLQLQIHPGADTLDFLGAAGSAIEGSSPHNQVYLMSIHELAENVECTIMSRYVDNLPSQRVPSYIEMDVRIAYSPRPDTELAVVGQNMLDAQHPEFAYLPQYEIQRGIYTAVTRTW